MANADAFGMTEGKNRLRGTLPKIGIRPTIDGRRNGVRESLEGATMKLARAAAELISANVYHPCGLPVECVIADTTIGGVKEAAGCAEKFARENVGVSLTVTPCWCYGSETMDMDPHTPKAIWGFNGTERPGAVYLAAVLAAHSQKGLPAFGIYGRDVQDIGNVGEIPADVEEKLLRFARAGLAAASMRGKSYLSIGSASMGIAGSIVEPWLFEKYLGMRCESVDMCEFKRRLDLDIYDNVEYERALAWVRDNITFGWDKNPADIAHSDVKKDEVLRNCVKMVMIGRDLMIGNDALAHMGYEEESCGHNAIAAGFQGQRQWTDHFPNGDFMESLLCSSFDWNGIREPFVMATENDACNGIAMLLGKFVTCRAQAFADVRTYWSPEAVEHVTGWKPGGLAENGFIHLINSGAVALDATGECAENGAPAIKRWWDITPDEAAACVSATQYCYGDLFYFRGGGYSSHLVTRGGMPITMSRLNIIDGLGPVMQIAEGFSAELPKDAHDALNARTDPTWPTTWFAPRLTGEGAFRDVYSVMSNWGANHGAFSYGHIGADLITLCSMLRIPVCMHNVPDCSIMRPSAWNSFGTKDLEGADFRACKNFGPLYGKR
jgi:L-fucose isomerase